MTTTTLTQVRKEVMTTTTIPQEKRLASTLHIAELNYESLGEDVRRVATRLARNAARVAETGTAGGAVREYGNDGAELDELITKRGEAWTRLQALRYVENGEYDR